MSADDPEVVHLSRATGLMGRDDAGRTSVTGEILWIDAKCGWAVCEDCFWWMPEDAHDRPADPRRALKAARIDECYAFAAVSSLSGLATSVCEI